MEFVNSSCSYILTVQIPYLSELKTSKYRIFSDLFVSHYFDMI